MTSDGAAPEVEASPVPVETAVSVRGVAVKPPAEPPHEAGVIDAVGRAASLHLDGSPAVEGEAGAGVALHTPAGYAERRPTPEHLVGRALDGAAPGNRNDHGVGLACQLRDNGFSFDVALEALFDFADRVPPGSHPYTPREAARTVKSVYRRPPREPWTVSGEAAAEDAAG